MFLNKLSKSFVYEIGSILKLFTCSLTENCVKAFEIILMYYYYNTFTTFKHRVSLSDSEKL